MPSSHLSSRPTRQNIHPPQTSLTSPSNEPTIIHHHETVYPGDENYEDDLDPDITHLSINSNYRPNFSTNRRNSGSLNRNRITKRPSFSVHHEVHPNLLIFSSQQSNRRTGKPHEYFVSPDMVDARSQRSRSSIMRVTNNFRKTFTTIISPIASISFNPRYTNRRNVLLALGIEEEKQSIDPALFQTNALGRSDEASPLLLRKTSITSQASNRSRGNNRGENVISQKNNATTKTDSGLPIWTNNNRQLDQRRTSTLLTRNNKDNNKLHDQLTTSRHKTTTNLHDYSQTTVTSPTPRR